MNSKKTKLSYWVINFHPKIWGINSLRVIARGYMGAQQIAEEMIARYGGEINYIILPELPPRTKVLGDKLSN